MHTRVENSITTRFHPTSEHRAANQNVPPNEDTENKVHRHKALKPPRKLSCLCEKNARVGSSKDFSCPRVVLKNKQPSDIPRCAKCGKSSQNHRTKGEDQRSARGTGRWVAPSILKTAQTFILCSGSTQQSVEPIKGVEDNRASNRQLELLRIFPESEEHIDPVNKPSDVSSITQEPFSTSIILKNSPQPHGAQCDIVNAPTSNLINIKHEPHATVIIDSNTRIEHQPESLVALVATGDSKLKAETSDSHCANVLRRISTYSVMSSQELHVQTSLHPMMQDLKLTISRVSAHLSDDTTKASSELIALPVTRSTEGCSFGHASLAMTQIETSQLKSTEQPNGMGNTKNFELINENVLVPAQDRADGSHVDKENLRSALRPQQGFIKKKSSTETHMNTLTRSKKYCRISEKQAPLKEVTRNSRGHFSREQTIITSKASDDPSEKNLRPIRLSRVNNTTVQSKITSRRKNQSARTNSYDTLPDWKLGGVTKLSSTNITKASEMKENLPQNSIAREGNSNPLEQKKSSARRQKVLSCGATAEKSAMHLSTRSCNANEMRMVKIYNCLADANLGRGCKGGTDKDVDNGSRARSVTDLLRDSGNVCPKSNKACDLRPDSLRSQLNETLHSSSSTRLEKSNKYGNEERGSKSGEEQPTVIALKNHKVITTHSRRQEVSIHADSMNGDPSHHEAVRNYEKKVHEPPFNSSEPIQKSANKPMKKSLPFVKQNKPKKSINTCTISLNILKQFFYRQGISAELIDRAERDLRKRYGGDGRSITHLDRLDKIQDGSHKGCLKPLERCDLHNTEIIQNEEVGFAKKSKDCDAMWALTHAQKPTEAGHSNIENPRESCAGLQSSLEQITSSDSRKSVAAETQTLQSFTSLKHVNVGCNEESINVTAIAAARTTDACTETVNLPLFSVSTNTEPIDQQRSQSDTSMQNDHSSIKNENLLAERVFDSSSNVSVTSSVSSCHYTRSAQDPPTILNPRVPVTALSVTPSANTGKTAGRHQRSMITSINDRMSSNKGRAQKSPWTFKKVQGPSKACKFAFRNRRGYCTRLIYSKRISKRNTLSSGAVSAKCANRSWAESDISHKARTPSMKRSLNGITLSEVTSLMEVLLCRMDTANADNRNSLQDIASSNSKAVLLKRTTYDSQLMSADKVASQSVSSFSAIVRACLLCLVYGIVCLFVFLCLQFTITCDFTSSRRFS